jgi:hypothetical protein
VLAFVVSTEDIYCDAKSMPLNNSCNVFSELGSHEVHVVNIANRTFKVVMVFEILI